ncbi:aldehyde dehydrogenase family protein, partial [Pseudomonas aeruginosa]
QAGKALDVLQAAWPRWASSRSARRSRMPARSSTGVALQRGELMALCTLEAGKSLQDGIDEIREAVDFCRYYAQQARQRLVRE